MKYDSADSTRQLFTSKERDTESGLDYFGARYYSSTQGRFTSVDPLIASGRPVKPQSWNRYAYVLNNPIRLIDPDGLMDNDEEFEPAPQVDPRPYGQGLIDKAQKNKSPFIVIYVAGITNVFISDTKAGRDELSKALETSVENIIPVTNNHGWVGGLSSNPNKESSKYAADLIKYALNKGFDPEQIYLVAHSNGVPTLEYALKQVSTDSKFAGAMVLGPNTGDVNVIGNIVGRASSSITAMSPNDMIVKAGPDLSAEEIAQGLRNNPDAVVYKTYQGSHSMQNYVRALREGNKHQLNPKP